jgi:DNA-directed RNA polymerase subunit RPC12/RpoP
MLTILIWWCCTMMYYTLQSCFPTKKYYRTYVCEHCGTEYMVHKLKNGKVCTNCNKEVKIHAI